MATLNIFKVDGLNMLDTDLFAVASMLPGSTTQFGWTSADGTFWLATGVGFTFDANGNPLTGVITGLTAIAGGNTVLQASGLSTDAATLLQGDMAGFYNILMPGNDDMTFGNGDDVIIGTAGDDVIDAGGGSDTFHWKEGDGSDTYNGGYGAHDVAALNVSGQWELDSDWHQLKFRDSSNPAGEEVSIRSVDTLKISTVEGGGENLIRVNTTGHHSALDTIEFEGGNGQDRVFVNAGVSTETRLDGGNGNDWLVGGRGDDVLTGGAGNDVLNGQDGNDDLFGGDGSDDLTGGNGFDTIIAGSGNDFIRWHDTEGNDWIDGGDDDDTVWARLSTNGHATLRNWHDYVELNTGNDTIRMDNVETIEISETGSSTVVVEDLSDTAMAHTQIVFNDSTGADTLDGHDTSNPLTFVRTLRGSAQTGDYDVFHGGASQDDTLVITGAVGIDTDWSFDGSWGWMTASEGHSGDVIYAREIEHVEMSLGHGDDTISISKSAAYTYDGTFTIDGGGGNDTLDTNARVKTDMTFDDIAGNDTAKTGSGDDTFVYRGGYDVYNGAAGSDLVTYENFNSAVYVNLQDWASSVWTRDSDDLSSGTWRSLGTVEDIENVAGTIGSDYVDGNGQDNTFAYVGANGTGGLDSFRGRGGSDTVDFSRFDSAVRVDLSQPAPEVATRDSDDLASGTWRDLVQVFDVENMTGTAKSDQFIGDDQDNTYSYVGADGTGGLDLVSGNGGSDTADFSRFDSAVWVHLATTGAEAKTRDSEDLNAGSWRDIADLDGIENVTGTGDSDLFRGDDADNTYTYSGANGSGGRDTFSGFAGSDTLDFSAFDSAVWADLDPLFGAEAWTRDSEDLSSGTWREIVDAHSVENLTGSDFDDRLTGDAGANRLDGGKGNDTLLGDGGADTFVFADGYGYDTIVGFGEDDVIELSVTGIDSFADVADNWYQDGDALVLQFRGHGSLAIAGQTQDTIDQDDFVFV